MGKRVFMVTAICGPRRVVRVHLDGKMKSEGQVEAHILTLVGVLGQGAFMSFLLGRCPSESVTFDGAPYVVTPLLFVDIVQSLMNDKTKELVGDLTGSHRACCGCVSSLTKSWGWQKRRGRGMTIQNGGLYIPPKDDQVPSSSGCLLGPIRLQTLHEILF